MFITLTCWILFCYLVGKFAEKRGRNFWTFALISVLISPIGGFIAALLAGNKTNAQQQSSPYYNSYQNQSYNTQLNHNYTVQPHNTPSLTNQYTQINGTDIFCSECGAKIPSTSKICPNCGNILHNL